VNTLVRFTIANIAIGSTIGWAAGDMILNSANPPVLAAMMAVPVGWLFGIGYLATALMFLGEDQDG
jgi:hypothetical protein